MRPALLGLVVAAAITNPSQITFTANGGSARPLAQRLADHCSVLDYSGSGATPFATANTQCRKIIVPTGTYNFSSTITMSSGRWLVGDGMQATILNYTGTGCAVSFDGVDTGGLRDLKIVTPGTAATERGICLTNAVGNTLRLRFDDVFVVSLTTPPTAGAYGVFIHSTTNNSLYYNEFNHLITLNYDRGVELLGDSGFGGANANWFHGYSANANVTGIYFDGKASDNYVQGHCNAGGTVFAQKCAIVGDGALVAAGNELHLVTDQGVGNGGITVQTNAANNAIFEFNEGAGTDTAGSSNNIYMDLGQTVNSRNVLVPNILAASINTLGSQGTSSQLFLGGSFRPTTEQHKVNVDYTVVGGDFYVGMSGLSASHTFTFGANSGQVVMIFDEDGSASAGHSLIIAPPAAGTVNGAANITLTTAFARELCQSISADGKKWVCVP